MPGLLEASGFGPAGGAGGAMACAGVGGVANPRSAIGYAAAAGVGAAAAGLNPPSAPAKLAMDDDN